MITSRPFFNIFTLCLVLLLLVISNGKTQTLVSSIYIGSEAASSAFESKDGGYFCCLYDYEIDATFPMIARLDQFGKVEWVRIPDFNNESFAMGFDLTEGLDSGVLFIENVRSFETGPIGIALYSPAGLVQWHRSFSVESPKRTSLSKIITDISDSSYLILSQAEDIHVTGLNLTKINKQGDIVWSRLLKNIDTNASLLYPSITPTSNGYLIASNSGGNIWGCEVAELSKSGELLWSNKYAFGYSSYVLSIVRSDNGNIFVLLAISDAFTYSPSLLCIDSTGQKKWWKQLSSPFIMSPRSCTLANNGDIVVACNLQKVTRETESRLDSLALIRISPAGEFVSGSMMAIAGTGQNVNTLAATRDNGYIVSGLMSDSIYGGTKAMVIKLDSNLMNCNFEAFSATLTDTGATYPGSMYAINDTSFKMIEEIYTDTSFTAYIQKDLCSGVSVRGTSTIESRFHIYPNPVTNKGVLIVHTDDITRVSNVNITIRDILGKIVHTVSRVNFDSSGDLVLDLTTLLQGTYDIVIEDVNNPLYHECIKFIK